MNKKYKVGDEVYLDYDSIKKAYKPYTKGSAPPPKEAQNYYYSLFDFAKDNVKGKVKRVFPSGSMNVEFEGNLFDIKPEMIKENYNFILKKSIVINDNSIIEKGEKIIITKSLKKQVEKTSSDSDIFFEKIEKLYNKHFPKSYINGGFSNNLVPAIGVYIALASSEKESINHILRNDPMFNTLMINGMDKDGSIIEDLEISFLSNGAFGVMLNNYQGSYKFKKVLPKRYKGNPNNILSILDKLFSDLHDVVEDNIEYMRVPFDIKSKL